MTQRREREQRQRGELQHDERGREWCAGRARHWTEHLVDDRQPGL